MVKYITVLVLMVVGILLFANKNQILAKYAGGSLATVYGQYYTVNSLPTLNGLSVPSISGEFPQQILRGAKFTFTAYPDSLSTVFVGFGAGICSGVQGRVCVFSVNSNINVISNWKTLYYTLTTSVKGTGVITGETNDCRGSGCLNSWKVTHTIVGNKNTYIGGSFATLTATPAAGSMFTGWSGEVCPGTSPCTTVFNSNKNIIATFAIARTLTTSTAGAGTGKIEGNTSPYATGKTAKLTAKPAKGSTFTGWSGACSGTGACKVVMDSDKSAVANFALDADCIPPTKTDLSDLKAEVEKLKKEQISLTKHLRDAL